MVKIIQLLCAGICLGITISSPAQTLPQKPALEKMIGNSLHEQKKWELKQLPRNSVLYKYQSRTTPFDPAPYGLKNEKLQGLNLPAEQQVTAQQQKIYLQSYLKEERHQDLPGKKKYWWSETGINSSHKFFPDSKNN